MANFQRYIASMLVLVLSLTWTNAAYGQDNDSSSEEGDYTVVKEGEVVPFNGYLFDSHGIINLMVNKNLEIQKITIIKDSEIEKLKIELDMARKQFALEAQIKDTLYNNVLKLKDERIKLLEDDKKWEALKVFGAMTLGIVLSVAIFFIAVQITTAPANE